MRTNFIDIHCHPAMKPFGKSFKKDPGQNNTNPKTKASVWHYDPPRFIDKVANILLTLTKFTQADFSTLNYGGAHVICASLYPLEKGFVKNKMGDKLPGDLMNNLIMGVGKERIDYLQDMKDYFTDLQNIYNYYLQLDGKEVRIEGTKSKYKIVSSFEEIEFDDDPAGETIYVILTIEGANVFNTGLTMEGVQYDEQDVLSNIDIVKNWTKRLFFITFTHHFYNELCGHAKSMQGITELVINQEEGMNTGFTPFGKVVLRKLLDNTDGKRILIDVKHMSVKARNEYYDILKTEYAGENIPIIVSHGAVNGYRSWDQLVIDNQNTYGKFLDTDINFYDEEVLRIADSRGIFGIQLDERRVASAIELKKAKKRVMRRKMLFHRSKLLWNQIQHIAEILDGAGKFGWGIQAIGSDFDGLIDPLNGFWTAEDMGILDSYLEKHAYNFIYSEEGDKLNSFNQIKPDEIIDRFMHDNMYDFLRRNF